MSVEFSQSVRGRIITHSETNRGPVAYSPDTPPIETVPLRKLETVFPNSIQVNAPPSTVTETILKDFGQGLSEGQGIIPCVAQPILESRYTRRRGGRVIGGGTSKEALRKARRKLRAKGQRKVD